MVHTRLRVRVRTSRLGYLASAGKRNLPRALRENFRHKNKTTKRKGHCCYWYITPFSKHMFDILGCNTFSSR